MPQVHSPQPQGRSGPHPSAASATVSQAAGHEWTLRWMDGSAVSCGTVYDTELACWRVWVVCNRELSLAGPRFDDEESASEAAQALQRDWMLEHQALEFRPLFRRVGEYLQPLREADTAGEPRRPQAPL